MNVDDQINTRDEPYRTALAELDRLAADDPSPATAAGTRLVILAAAVENYESNRFMLPATGTGPDSAAANIIGLQGKIPYDDNYDYKALRNRKPVR